MENQTKKEITNEDLLDSINRSFSKLEEKIGSVSSDLQLFKIETNTNFRNLESDLKSFKSETRDSFAELNEKIDDLEDTVGSYDKRIEVLETRV